jgi:hypothetical protein
MKLAKRDAALREPGPLRPVLMPAAMAGSRPSAPSRAARRMMSAGSFWPSPPVVARVVDRDHLAERVFRHLGEGFLD